MAKDNVYANVPSISDSAFLVNYQRSKQVAISQDIFAKLWVDKNSTELANSFDNAVYKNDDMVVALRSRFFLNHLKAFSAFHNSPVFINLGAGFTSYPYLVDGLCSVEIDLPKVIKYKEDKVEKLFSENRLPKKDVIFIECDFQNAYDMIKLSRFLNSYVQKRPSFVLMEGIVYYLSPIFVDKLFQMCHQIQTVGSEIGIEYWDMAFRNHPVFKRLEDFFKDKLKLSKQEYYFISLDYLRYLSGYKLMEATTVSCFERHICTQYKLADDLVNLPTSLAMLRKV